MSKTFIKHVKARNVTEAKENVMHLGAALGQRLFGENIALFVILKANTRLKFIYQEPRFFNDMTARLVMTLATIDISYLNLFTIRIHCAIML